MNEGLQAQMEAVAAVPPDVLADCIATASVDKLVPVRRQGNKYVHLVKKGDGEDPDIWGDISNFVLELKRDEIDVDHPDQQENIQRYIRLVSDETKSWSGLVQAKDLSSLREFETLLVSKGNFSFYGSALEFKRIWHMATQENQETRPRVHLKSIAGYEETTGNFIAGNGVVAANGEIHRKDKDGLTNVNGTTYRLMTRDRSDDKARMPVLDFDGAEREIKFKVVDLVGKTQQLWGPQIELLWGWALTHLWRWRWWKTYGNFPLCMLAAPPGVGKNQIMMMFHKVYGLPFSPTFITGLTPTGLLTLVNSSCNIPVWIDEWKNSVSEGLRELFKANADGSDKVVGTLDPLKIKTRSHRTGMIITGEFRALDSALNQRYILINPKRKDDSKLLTEAHALSPVMSAYTVQLLKQYEDNWTLIKDMYEGKRFKWEEKLKGRGVDPRIIENYAKVYVALQAFVGNDDDREERFFNYMETKVTSSGNMNPAIEALRYMPRFVTGRAGRKGWVPCHVDPRKKKFCICPKEFARVWSDYSGDPLISTDDLFQYAQESEILHPSQTSSASLLVSLRMSQGATTVTRRGWMLNMNNELVREVAEELTSYFNSQ